MPAPVVYRRRTPESSVLYAAVSRGVPEFLQAADARGQQVPACVQRELRGYLDCGQLDNGFARVRCADCGYDRLVAFSCKGRGFCPSCCGRRMADSDGRVSVRLKLPWSDGATHVVLTPLELVETLAALVPPPRVNLVRYMWPARVPLRGTPRGPVRGCLCAALEAAPTGRSCTG